MTLFGYCPSCGYPWYCMCNTCKPKAPKGVLEWKSNDNVKDGMECPHCGEVENYDTLAWICEEIEPVFLEAMERKCRECVKTECDTKCPLRPFTKTYEYYNE